MKQVTACLVLLLTSGCATIPDVTVSYYLPKVTLQTTVVRTIGCDVQDNAIIASTVVTTPIYSNDQAKVKAVSLEKLDAWYANSDLSFTFYADGRLKGVNTTQTGQGGEIIKAAVALAGAVGGLASSTDTTVMKECDYVRKNGKNGVLTLTFVHTEKFASDSVARRVIQPAADSNVQYEEVKTILGEVCFEATKGGSQPRRAPAPDKSWWIVELPVVEPAVFHVTVTQNKAGGVECSSDEEVWSGAVSVPQQGEEYSVPIPKPVLFGQQVFVLAVEESGAISNVRYAKNVGLAAAMGGATEVLTALKEETPTAEALRLKAEADVIAQQQRLVACKLSPESCK